MKKLGVLVSTALYLLCAEVGAHKMTRYECLELATFAANAAITRDSGALNEEQFLEFTERVVVPKLRASYGYDDEDERRLRESVISAYRGKLSPTEVQREQLLSCMSPDYRIDLQGNAG